MHLGSPSLKLSPGCQIQSLRKQKKFAIKNCSVWFPDDENFPHRDLLIYCMASDLFQQGKAELHLINFDTSYSVISSPVPVLNSRVHKHT